MEAAKVIIVKLAVEGVHKWAECPILEVNYLKNEHRHMFHITCKKSVSHNERQVEIIQLKHQLNKFLNDTFFKKEIGCLDFQNMSCETIAETLLKAFQLNYVEVLEDNENGAAIAK